MENIVQKRLNKAKSFSRLFYLMPFVRAILLNGSLAFGYTQEESDIDLLIIVKSGRIFTARFFINIISMIIGQKRSKDESKPHAGKFCFNYFLADGYLKIPTGRGEKIDQYCAENYSRSILIVGNQKLFGKFFEVNKGLFKHSQISVISTEVEKSFNSQKISPPLSGSRDDKKYHLFEYLLSGSFGNWLEQKLKAYQIKKIENDPRTEKYPDLIVYNDNELRFHPPKHKSIL